MKHGLASRTRIVLELTVNGPEVQESDRFCRFQCCSTRHSDTLFPLWIGPLDESACLSFENRTGKQWVMNRTMLIYAVISGRRIIYVGQTDDLASRKRSHGERFKGCAWKVLRRVPEWDALRVEGSIIRRLWDRGWCERNRIAKCHVEETLVKREQWLEGVRPKVAIVPKREKALFGRVDLSLPGLDWRRPMPAAPAFVGKATVRKYPFYSVLE